jgi:hypothetical protein
LLPLAVEKVPAAAAGQAGRVVTKVTILPSTVPLSMGRFVSGLPHSAFPNSAIDPVTLLLLSTFKINMTDWPPAAGAAALAKCAIAASVPQLPAIPFVPAGPWPNAAAAARQEIATSIVFLIFMHCPPGYSKLWPCV